MLLQLIDILPTDEFRIIVVLPTDVQSQRLLSRELQIRGIETLLINLSVLRRKYFTVFGTLKFIWRTIVSTAHITNIIRKNRVGIVHSNTLAVISGALAANLTRTAHVWHVHEIILHPQILRRITTYLALTLSTFVVSVSYSVQENLNRSTSTGRCKILVIHNCIDQSRSKKAAGTGAIIRQNWSVDTDTVLVAMIGRISAWKGQDYFLEIVNIINGRSLPAHYAIVGDVFPGNEELLIRLREMIKIYGLSDAVTLSGFRSDVASVFDACDILVLPSVLPEPFGLVILEAMAAGRPVVANAHGGSIELIIDGVTGYLVEPNQRNDMADAIARLIENPDLRAMMGKNAQERLNQDFSLDSFAAKWLDLYRELT